MRALASLAFVLFLTTPALAEDRATAERAFRTAERAYKAQNFAAAIHHYEAAYAALPLPEIAFSAAQAYRKQYRVDAKPEYVRRAIELYEIYLAKVKVGGRVSDAADNLGEMKIELARLESAGKTAGTTVVAPAIKRTQLAISPQLVSRGAEGSELATYRVTLDGKPVEPFLPVDVQPGMRTIRVTATGFIPAEETVRAIEGVSDVIELKLQPLPAKVTVKTEAGARIIVDGRERGIAPIAPLELPAGKHVIAFVRRGRALAVREIEPARGESLAIDQSLLRTRQRRTVPWLAIGASTAGALAIATGIYAAVQDGRAETLRAEIDLGDASEDLADRYDETIRSRDRFETVAWVAGGVALASGVAALGLYWFDAPSTEQLRLAPTGSATSAGVVIGGQF